MSLRWMSSSLCSVASYTVDAADHHRLEHGEGVERAGAADVDADPSSVVSAVVGANL